MDSAGHKLLAGACLAKHQNACWCLCNDLYQLFQLFGRCGLANDDFVHRAVCHNTHPPKQL